MDLRGASGGRRFWLGPSSGWSVGVRLSVIPLAALADGALSSIGFGVQCAQVPMRRLCGSASCRVALDLSVYCGTPVALIVESGSPSLRLVARLCWRRLSLRVEGQGLNPRLTEPEGVQMPAQNPQHGRRFSLRTKMVTCFIATGAAAGVAMAAGTASAAPADVWDRVAACESGGNWKVNTGNGFQGGLQFTPSTWKAFGGTKYAPYAHQATKAQQIAVAERVLDGQGPGAWPVCSKKAGLA